MAACETVRARFVRGPRARGGPASGVTGAAGAACAWCEGLNKADAEHELGFAFGRPHQPHPPHLVRQASHHTPSMVQRPMHVVFYNWCAAPLCRSCCQRCSCCPVQPDLELLREPCSTYCTTSVPCRSSVEQRDGVCLRKPSHFEDAGQTRMATEGQARHCLLAQRAPCLHTLQSSFSASLVTRHWCLQGTALCS